MPIGNLLREISNYDSPVLFLLGGKGKSELKGDFGLFFYLNGFKNVLALMLLVVGVQISLTSPVHAKIYLSINKTEANSGCSRPTICYTVQGDLAWTSEEDAHAVPQGGRFPTWTLQPVVNGVVQPLIGYGTGFCTYQGYLSVGLVRQTCNIKSFYVPVQSSTGQPPVGAKFCFRILDGNNAPLPANVVTWECAPLPPPNITCDIGGPYTINFGTVDVASLNGRTASVSARASCTSNVSATMKLIPSDGKSSVTLMPGLFGTLSVDGQPGATGSRKTVGPAGANFQLTTTLQTNGTVAPGTMKGSAIVRIEVN